MAVGEVLNLDCFVGTNQQKIAETLAEAQGRRVNRKLPGAGPHDRIVFEEPPNGGIVNPRREHLKIGQTYFRFVSKSAEHGRKVGGTWWMEFDTLNNIYARYRAAGANPAMKHQGRIEDRSARSSFREWLALTYEWNEIEEVVVAQLWARLDAYTGAGRVAAGSGAHAGDTRGFGYAPHLSHLFTIKQLFVPEVWVYREKAFPSPRIHDFAEVEKIVSGQLAPA